jgi:hypothetical protein
MIRTLALAGLVVAGSLFGAAAPASAAMPGLTSSLVAMQTGAVMVEPVGFRRHHNRRFVVRKFYGPYAYGRHYNRRFYSYNRFGYGYGYRSHFYRRPSFSFSFGF